MCLLHVRVMTKNHVFMTSSVWTPMMIGPATKLAWAVSAGGCPRKTVVGVAFLLRLQMSVAIGAARDCGGCWTRGDWTRASSSSLGGRGWLGSSQPWSMAIARNWPALRRPMRPARSVSRSDSPSRIRVMTCRISNISNLLLAISLPPRVLEGWF